MKALTAAALRLHWGGTMVMLREDMLWLHYGYDIVMLWLLLWAVSPEERLCYGCCLSQEVINMSVIPMAPCIIIICIQYIYIYSIYVYNYMCCC